jgi:23S rRNA (cytidine1920-2'-O)/16S rRNA (cytidine1409-2'-O)-methyltransferase
VEKIRLDILVQRQAGVSPSKAQGLIHTGQVTGSSGEKLTKPGAMIAENATISIASGPKYVSRGGLKLEAGLNAFPIPLDSNTAIDVGASTGGFTDCLLQRGASKVYAVDVGYGQLDWKLRTDPRVVVLERTNIRHVTSADLDDAPAVFTADCSFISLKLVLPPLKSLLAPRAEGIVLIKPQFEAGKDQVGEGGVVRDESIRQDTIDTVLTHAEGLGFSSRGVIPSPITGPAGNREFLAHLRLE